MARFDDLEGRRPFKRKPPRAAGFPERSVDLPRGRSVAGRWTAKAQSPTDKSGRSKYPAPGIRRARRESATADRARHRRYDSGRNTRTAANIIVTETGKTAMR